MVRLSASVVHPAADAARAYGGRGGDRCGDRNAPGPVDPPCRGSNYDCLHPYQRECRALLRPRDCAAERLPGRAFQSRVVRAETGRWRSPAPGPDRSEVTGWEPDERGAAVLLARHRRLSVAAKVGKRDRLLPISTLVRARRVVEGRQGRRHVGRSRNRGKSRARDCEIPLLGVRPSSAPRADRAGRPIVGCTGSCPRDGRRSQLASGSVGAPSRPGRRSRGRAATTARLRSPGP